MDTRIAVVIPCYNDGGTLFEALASVERQEDYELVVVNDGSDEPATHRVLTDLRSRGIRVVDRDNGGLSAARMTGTRATSARYVFPLDADDILEPGALSRLADALDDDPAAVAAWGDVEQFGRYTRRLRVQRTLDPWRVTYLTGIPGTVLYRRSALLAVGGWHLQEGYEDWDLWMSLAERGSRGVYVPGLFLRHRLHGQRLWSRWVPRHAEFYEELRRRHRALFAARSANRRQSPAPGWVKLALPAIEGLPMLSEHDKHRLYQLATEPGRVLSGALRGRLARGQERGASAAA